MDYLKIERLINDSYVITQEQVDAIFNGKDRVQFSFDDFSYCSANGFCDNGYLVFVIDVAGMGIEIRIFQIDSRDMLSYRFIKPSNYETATFEIITDLYGSLISRGMFPYP